jgi:argininosuccinate synthase
MRKSLALAFSGGLDTSFCVPRLAEDGWAVHTVYVNTGGTGRTIVPPSRRRRMRSAPSSTTRSTRERPSSTGSCGFLIQGNVLRGEVYPLSVAAERTQQALSVIETARTIGARAVAHGSPGAGNDQVRFDVALRVLAPDLEIVTPIRDLGVSRDQAVAYLAARNLPVPAQASAYSVNRGLWGTTWGGGWTHDTWAGPPDELLDPPAGAPVSTGDRARLVARSARALDGEPLEGPTLVERLKCLPRHTASAGASTWGETALGIKGRIGFEAGAALLLIGRAPRSSE